MLGEIVFIGLMIGVVAAIFLLMLTSWTRRHKVMREQVPSKTDIKVGARHHSRGIGKIAHSSFYLLLAISLVPILFFWASLSKVSELNIQIVIFMGLLIFLMLINGIYMEKRKK